MKKAYKIVIENIWDGGQRVVEKSFISLNHAQWFSQHACDVDEMVVDVQEV